MSAMFGTSTFASLKKNQPNTPCSTFTIGNSNFCGNLMPGRESEKSFEVFAKTKLFFLLVKYSSPTQF